MSIVEFLMARIAEDEAVARQSSHPFADSEFDVDRWDELQRAEDRYHMQPHGRKCGWKLGEQIRDDCTCMWPARVLADCAAKRQVIGIVVSWRHDTVEDCWYSCGMTYDTDVEDACCNEASTGRCTCGLEYRQRQLLQPLASVYADHPDFEPAWRP